MGFRDDNVIVIDTGSWMTRAVVGLAESMTPPEIRVPTQLGIIEKKDEEISQQQYLFDTELEEAIKRKEPDLKVIRPIVGGMINDWDAIEIFWFFILVIK